MDDWDRPSRGWKSHIRTCNMKERVRIHRKGGLFYVSLFARTNEGLTFEEIKESEECADIIAGSAVNFLTSMIRPDSEWCIVTAPRRRHTEGYNFADAVARKISEGVRIKYYEEAVQCVNRNRINPDFYLLREIKEQRIILFDDILTTGSTLTALAELFEDRKQIFCLIGIKN